VVGCAAAYHLSRAAARVTATSSSPPLRVLLLEPHAVGVGSTSRSAGLVVTAASDRWKSRLVGQTLSDVSVLQRELGTQLGLRRCGGLRCALTHLESYARTRARAHAHIPARALVRRAPQADRPKATGPPAGQSTLT
jgi:glycine/D-amino acid oxidase-like deaminating enzyme